MTKEKIEYVAWGLDDATPSIMNEAVHERKEIFKKITKRLDRLNLIVLLSMVVQCVLAYVIYIKL